MSTKRTKVSSKSPSLARVLDEVMSKETDVTWFKFSLKVGNSLWNLIVTIPGPPVSLLQGTSLRLQIRVGSSSPVIQHHSQQISVVSLEGRFCRYNLIFPSLNLSTYTSNSCTKSMNKLVFPCRKTSKNEWGKNSSKVDMERSDFGTSSIYIFSQAFKEWLQRIHHPELCFFRTVATTSK